MPAFPPSKQQVLKKNVQKVTGKRKSLPHLSELAEFFVEEAGGPRVVAALLYKEWAAAPIGGVVRARILDLITRVWRFASDTVGKREDLGLLTEEDLDKLLQEQLKGLIPEGLDDGPTAAAAATSPEQGQASQGAILAPGQPEVPGDGAGI